MNKSIPPKASVSEALATNGPAVAVGDAQGDGMASVRVDPARGNKASGDGSKQNRGFSHVNGR